LLVFRKKYNVLIKKNIFFGGKYMNKNKKMSTMIALSAILVSVICIGVLYFASSSKSKSIMEQSTVNNMETALNL